MFARLFVRLLDRIPHVRRQRVRLARAEALLAAHALVLAEPPVYSTRALEARLRAYLACLLPVGVSFSIMVRRPSRGIVIADVQAEGVAESGTVIVNQAAARLRVGGAS
jgi:hypothetical protein